LRAPAARLLGVGRPSGIWPQTIPQSRFHLTQRQAIAAMQDIDQRVSAGAPMAAAESVEPPGVIAVDISRLSQPNDVAAYGRRVGRVSAIYFAGLFAVLGWLVVIVLLTNGASDTVQALAFFGLFVAPFVYLGWRGLLIRESWESGVSDFPTSADFSERENAEEIPFLNIQRRQLLDRLQAFLATRRGPSLIVDEAKLRRQQLLHASGAIIVCAIAIVSDNLWIILVLLVALPFGLVNVRRRSLPDLDAVLARDKRSPVLLLRSFRDEYVRVPNYIPTRLGSINPTRRLEQGLTILNALGPLIAVGNPGEPLPHIGAARAFLSNDAWQPAVLRWIDEAVLVVMIAGATEMIRWELERIVEKDSFHKFAIVLPPGQPSERWHNVMKVLSKTIWGPALASVDPKDVLLVQLRPNGTILIVRRTGLPFLQDYQLGMAILLYDRLIEGRG
jgi:hypothetical protein